MAVEPAVLLFVEGDTEVVFYQLLVEMFYEKGWLKRPVKQFLIKNLRGIGGFKRQALRYYLNEVVPRYEDCKFSIGLAYDTDVFEFARQPQIDWQKIDNYFRALDVEYLIHIPQELMIEDLFLEDYTGILKFLNLPIGTEIPAGSGYRKLQTLFNKSKKIYYKGEPVRKMLKSLDLERIYLRREDVLEPFFMMLQRASNYKAESL